MESAQGQRRTLTAEMFPSLGKQRQPRGRDDRSRGTVPCDTCTQPGTRTRCTKCEVMVERLTAIRENAPEAYVALVARLPRE